MVILDNGILLSSNEARNAKIALSKTGNGVLLPHKAADRASQVCKDIWYDAKSERAVQCLLNSSIKNMICRPLTDFNKEYAQVACNDQIIQMTLNGGNDSPARKLMALLANRAIISTGCNVTRAEVGVVYRREEIIRFIGIESNSNVLSQVARVTFDSKPCINAMMPAVCIAKASDALWANGYIIKYLGTTRYNGGINLAEMGIFATPYTRGANTTQVKKLVEKAIGMKTWLAEEVAHLC